MLRVGRGGKVIEPDEDSGRNITEDLNYILSFSEDDLPTALPEEMSREGLLKIIDKLTTIHGGDQRAGLKELLEVKDRKFHLKTYHSCFVGAVLSFEIEFKLTGS